MLAMMSHITGGGTNPNMADQLERQLKDLERQRQRGVLTDEEYAVRRQALVNAAPVVAEKKRGGLMKWGMLGCLGIFAAVGIFVVLMIVLLAAAFSSDEGIQELATGNADDVSVRVSGSAGLKFSGSIGSASGQRTVDGTVPATFTIPGENSSGIFTAVIQKMDADGTLEVTLECREGRQQNSTTAEYGVVTVSCGP